MEVMRKAVRWKSGSLSVVKSEKAAQKWAASIMQKTGSEESAIYSIINYD